MNKIDFIFPKLDYFSSEAYKSLRTSIQFCGTDVKVIAVTSCVPNEGKTTICVELAKSLAETGKKVLLIDSDMRHSVMSITYTNTRGIVGLSQYLSGQASLTDVLYSTQADNMFIIFAGAFPPNATELLASPKFNELIDNASKSFDYIIIDTPPLGLVVDAAIVANISKNAIIVIGKNKIKYKFAQDIKSQLERADAHVLGVVLNSGRASSTSKAGYGKYYGYSYGKYGKYGYGKYGKYGKYGYGKYGYGKYGQYGSGPSESKDSKAKDSSKKSKKTKEEKSDK